MTILRKPWPAETFQAINRRLGNVATLGEILEEISEVSPPYSVLQQYSEKLLT
jgi:hypothetical protein